MRTTPGPASRASGRTDRWLERRSFSNLMRMGHCAPTVLRTVLEATGDELATRVQLAAGLPGGIGNTGEECGGVTAPLMYAGLRHAGEPLKDGLPPVIFMGHDLLRRFTSRQGTFRCAEIRGTRRLPLPCIGVVVRAPGQCRQTLDHDCGDAITGERREAFRRLHAHLDQAHFHCSHAVFDELQDVIRVDGDLVDASAGFIGGFVFCGLTCNALTAGVMALGAARGEIENSRLRVMRMIGTMALGGDAFADRINAFNRLMNMGNRLALWFSRRFGSARCASLTGCDFGTVVGVRDYVEGAGVSRCRMIAKEVADELRRVLEEPPAPARAAPTATPDARLQG